MLAERYLDNPWVIGADLRNEIRAIPGISTKIASIFIMAFTINFSVNGDFLVQIVRLLR